MNNPAPGASLRAVGTAPLHSDFSPPVLYRVAIEFSVDGRILWLVGFVAVAAPAVAEFDGKDNVDSEIVFIKVKGINRNPTPVLAVLPTRRSPLVVNLIFAGVDV